MSNTSSASLSMSPPESPSLADKSSPSLDTFAFNTPATSHEDEMDQDATLEIIVDNKEQETENITTNTSIGSPHEEDKQESVQLSLEHTEPSLPAPQNESTVIEDLNKQEATLTVDNSKETAPDTLPTVIEESDLDFATDTETAPVAAVSVPLTLQEENVRASSASAGAIDKSIIKVEDEATPTELMTTTTAQIDQQSSADAPLKIEHEPAEPSAIVSSTNNNSNGNTSCTDPQPSLSPWDVANERVAAVALQCLTKDKDTELSYVAILSAITVLQSKEDQQPDFEDMDQPLSAEMKAYKTKVAASYSQILDILCKPEVADGLGKETLRQGVMAPEELYAQFYGSIEQAGYDLQV